MPGVVNNTNMTIFVFNDTKGMKKYITLIIGILASCALGLSQSRETVLIEAEAFTEHGG